MKNKIDFLEQIEIKVRDTAEEITKTAITMDAGEFRDDVTIFTVNDNNGFNIGDEIYLTNRSGKVVFTKVIDTIESNKIGVEGDQASFQKGSLIKKTDALKYLDEAVAVYSKYNPLCQTEKKIILIPGETFDLPGNWEIGFSTIDTIEYPIGYIPKFCLNDDDYCVYLDDRNVYRLKFSSPLYSAFIINYFISHSFDFENPYITSIPDCDFYCVCNIAAGFYLLSLASRFGENVNPSIGLVAVNYDDKSKKYRALASDLFLQAASWMGVNVSGKEGMIFEQPPASSDQKINV